MLKTARTKPQRIIRIELVAWLLLLVLFNLPLLSGTVSDRFVFDPARFVAGEWWRLFTFPLVHVSPYHLVLDAGAFLFLWWELRRHGTCFRWLILLCCWAGSLALPLLVSPQIDVYGLCGLSGIGHGLFLAYALDCVSRGRIGGDAWLANISGLMAAALVGKSVLETVSGGLFFTDLHFGTIGVPIVSTHLGGVLGGLAGWVASRVGSRPERVVAGRM